MVTSPGERPPLWSTGVAWVQLLDADEERITWRARVPRGPTEEVAVCPVGYDGMLEEFVRLRQGDPAEIAEFVARYGVPELCAAHGLPDGHALLEHAPDQAAGYCPLGEDGDVRVLATAHVRAAARSFAAATRLAPALTACRAGRLDDWTALLSWPGTAVVWMPQLDAVSYRTFVPHVRRDEEPGLRFALDIRDGARLEGDHGLDDYREGRAVYAEWLTWLLRISPVSSRVVWPETGRFRLTNSAHGTLGMLAILLARSSGRSDPERDYCAACGSGFTPSRAPRPGEQLYCGAPECDQVRKRRKAAAYRARRKEGVNT